ncbi:MAG: 3-deoxy-7-phosphoheptulonate synthase [Deltaproteobacteria bacterium]|nr:3-deoxy-7-phosphoheptulonate synthase [Deltaproteobacteria bacterium]
MTITAAYQGIEGAHSDVALASHLGAMGVDHVRTGLGTFRQVATAVIAGRADVGLLPVDNAIAGTVRDGYDLLAQFDLVPICEIEWRMDHRLLAVPGAELSGVREVFAHPLALAECGRFLGTLAGARVIPSVDTGVAARDVAAWGDPARAAIAPPEAAAIYGLVELARNVADHPENYTRFVLFRSPESRPEVQALGGRLPPARRKTSLLFATRHEQGALARCLGSLAEAGINLAKLESRPKLGKAWEYLFYVDIEGDVTEPRIGAALGKLREQTTSLHVIGSYDVGAASLPAGGGEPRCALPPVAAGASEPPALPSSAKNWPKAARTARPGGTRIPIGSVLVGGEDFIVIAGPCSVESREQMMATARRVVAGGAHLLRGGAFKPRTSPYAFQGLGWEGVALLAEAGRAAGVPVVSEVMSPEQVERMAREVDFLQIGARNMQNFDLLKAVGRTDRPVMLKRGLSASLDELLAAAEYVLAEGNPHVALCERGIRTFETATRNTLDLSAVPVLRERTHLPVIVDPSHGVGVRRWIRPLCRAAKAVGAHAIMIEVHPNPPEAKSDAEQALTFDDFEAIMDDLSKIP